MSQSLWHFTKSFQVSGTEIIYYHPFVRTKYKLSASEKTVVQEYGLIGVKD